MNIKSSEAKHSSKMLASICKLFITTQKTIQVFIPSGFSAVRIRLSAVCSSEVILKPLIFRKEVGMLVQRIIPEGSVFLLRATQHSKVQAFIHLWSCMQDAFGSG
jgi:hypothetical protein